MRRRVLMNSDWETIIQGSGVLLGQFNAHSQDWNVHYSERRDMLGLEHQVDTP